MADVIILDEEIFPVQRRFTPQPVDTSHLAPLRAGTPYPYTNWSASVSGVTEPLGYAFTPDIARTQSGAATGFVDFAAQLPLTNALLSGFRGAVYNSADPCLDAFNFLQQDVGETDVPTTLSLPSLPPAMYIADTDGSPAGAYPAGSYEPITGPLVETPTIMPTVPWATSPWKLKHICPFTATHYRKNGTGTELRTGGFSGVTEWADAGLDWTVVLDLLALPPEAVAYKEVELFLSVSNLLGSVVTPTVAPWNTQSYYSPLSFEALVADPGNTPLYSLTLHTYSVGGDDYPTEPTETEPYSPAGLINQSPVLRQGPIIRTLNQNALAVQEALSLLSDIDNTDADVVQWTLDLNGHRLTNILDDESPQAVAIRS